MMTSCRPMALLLAALLAAPLAGCVSSSKYEKLQGTLKKTRADTKAKLAQRDETIATLKKDLADREAKIKQLQGQIKGLEAKIDDLEQEGKARQKAHQKLQEQLADVVKDRARLRTSAAQLKKALVEMSKRKAKADRRVAQFKGLLKKFKKLIDAGRLKVKIVDGRMVLEMATDVLFASGSARLSDEGNQAIMDVAMVLLTLPSERRFQVEGHTDNVPIKTARFRSNWDLAAARALNVVKTMVKAGLSGKRISAASFGEFRPVASNDTPSGRAANRRIEIVVMPDLSALPGFDELRSAVGG